MVYLFLGEESEAVLKCPVLILKFDKFLLISFEDIDLIMKMPDEDVFLIGFDLDR